MSSQLTPNTPRAFDGHRLGGTSDVVATKTADYTLTTADDVILADATAAAITALLPAAANCANKIFTIVKIDATANNVIIDGNASETVGGLTTAPLTRQYSYKSIMSDGANWQVISGFTPGAGRLLGKATIDLTTLATTALINVPTGRTLKVTDVWLEGGTTVSGGTTSVLKVGDTAAYSLLNGSAGHSFTSATATTLLATGARAEASNLYNLADADSGKASLMPVKSFAGAKTIAANVSGAGLVTAGTVIVEVYGYFI